ncbi:MAG: Gfo/Idh/MocA family oxidoreductase [Clostridia bacterium]|nr:Gfo/Idh/MocA family oxidoreductase [Clostridia bacterium]
MEKKRYACVGTGGRLRMWLKAMAVTYKDSCEIVGLCDINRTRLENTQTALKRDYDYHDVALYNADEFEKMIEEQKPDIVVVATVDRTHHRYIIKAMEMGCDVISEKPMTVDDEKCAKILEAIDRTGRELRVSFNYRYAPHHSQLRQIIKDGTIGDVKQIHFEWLLNTSHGADYFRRWHRDKRNSGGLMVHKSTHHFDLVNFWINSFPVKVYAQGGLKFYGRENAEERGITKFYSRCYGSENAKGDPWAIDMTESDWLRELYLDAEKDDGYIRDQSVFGDNISIEDVMNVIVNYDNGAIMSYSLNAFSPYEGLNVCITGTKGRVEMKLIESIYINGQDDASKEGLVESERIIVYPMFEPGYEVEIQKLEGGHGGGDDVMLDDIFNPNAAYDPLHRAASHIDGAMSIMTGICANKSMATGQPINVFDYIDIPKSKLRKD